ncbi:MAG TPA: hypothetical protein VHT75_13295 [Acidimicrobiales bacterium]|nr:hypothetical protein [Acidimicrobiales bacterium]
MASACIHGFAPGSCLICQTLDRPSQTTNRPAQTLDRPSQTTNGRPGGPAPSPRRPGRDRRAAPATTGPRVVPAQGPGTSGAVKLLVLAVAVVAVIVVAWTVLHIVFAVIRVIELIGVALVAGYIGWLAGVWHGHRTAGKTPGRD